MPKVVDGAVLQISVMRKVDMCCEAVSSRGSLEHSHGSWEARPDEWLEARG
jgi:hypothetical protein